jgi:hypothetical protein
MGNKVKVSTRLVSSQINGAKTFMVMGAKLNGCTFVAILRPPDAHYDLISHIEAHRQV